MREKLKKIFASYKGEYVFDSDLIVWSNEMIINQKSNIPKLYRYSEADYFNIRNLEKEEIHLSELGSMNDIFEGMSCNIDDEVLKKIDLIKDIAYLKAFSENKNNLLMWSHYAKSHTGICVEYDFSKLEDKTLFHLFPVIYSNDKMNIKAIDKYSVSGHCCMVEEKDIDDLLFTKDIMASLLVKSDEWSYEKEWRIVCTYLQLWNNGTEFKIDEDEKSLYLLDSQNVSVKDCISAIYLGARMNDTTKIEHLKEIAEKLQVPIFKMKLSKEKFELEKIKY